MTTLMLSQAQVRCLVFDFSRSQTIVWDQRLPGFGVRLTAASKAYVVQWRTKGKSVRQTLGPCSGLTYKEARQAAVEILERAQQEALCSRSLETALRHTVSSLLDAFVEGYVLKRHKPTTQRTELQLINQHIRPHLGSVVLRELTRPQIVSWHSDKMQAPIAANRALAHLSKACSFAVARDWLRFNPCIGIERNKEKQKDRWFSDEELVAMFSKIRINAPRSVFDAMAILALTGMRCGEFFGDFAFNSDRKVIWLGDSKTGAKSIALNEHANLFLKSKGDSIVKPTYGEMYLSFKRAAFECVILNASPHTFRHTLATYMAEHGDSALQIAGMGGWKSLSMVQRYVNLHGVGTPHPTPAGERIAKAIGLSNLTA